MIKYIFSCVHCSTIKSNDTLIATIKSNDTLIATIKSNDTLIAGKSQILLMLGRFLAKPSHFYFFWVYFVV